ncbi:MAG: hypothetical protein Q9202_000020 [Teloschistes flavicans]
MERRPGAEITRLLLPILHDGKDEYGKDKVPPLPLSFDRVNEGNPPRSSAPLLNLPFELLGTILEHIPPESLSSLALVNHDCQQLARSRQFASVQLDYSNASLGLLAKLLEEGRQCSDGETNMPTSHIGTCIRRITVATYPGWIVARHGIDLDDGFSQLAEGEQTERMVTAAHLFFKVYVPKIEAILDRQILPNLELLYWEDAVTLPRSFFQRLAHSTIKHLKIRRAKIDEEFAIEFREPGTAIGWPLRTLHLEIAPNFWVPEDISTYSLCESILRLCSRTLEDLTLIPMNGEEEYAFTGNNIPQFPSLRRLCTHNAKSSMLEVLVHDDLRYLNIELGLDAVRTDFLGRRGNIPSFESFIWYPSSENTIPDRFLRANRQIQTLAFTSAFSEIIIESRIFPIICPNFTNLTSLQLKWTCTFIPVSAQQQISLLKSLKQIHLSAGNHFGWQRDWLIDHNSLRQNLCTLPLLEKMAFSRDSYPTGFPWLSHESYYSHSSYPDTSSEFSAKWERSHRRRMIFEANKYVNVMPALRWMYFGQLPMSVEVLDRPLKRKRGRTMKTWLRSAHVLSNGRDDCWTLLHKIFEGHTG